MLIVKLREAMQAYFRKYGTKMTYKELAKRTGMSAQTFAAIATVEDYNPSLDTIEAICRALEVTPGELLELTDGPPPKPKRRKSR